MRYYKNVDESIIYMLFDNGKLTDYDLKTGHTYPFYLTSSHDDMIINYNFIEISKKEYYTIKYKNIKL
jgi:hypothetical protein